jgi:hypothetical protein
MDRARRHTLIDDVANQEDDAAPNKQQVGRTFGRVAVSQNIPVFHRKVIAEGSVALPFHA